MINGFGVFRGSFLHYSPTYQLYLTRTKFRVDSLLTLYYLFHTRYIMAIIYVKSGSTGNGSAWNNADGSLVVR
ncbi:hypothetical protein [Microcystis sp. LEGE 08355]|uniref:hypothetical protein n=1 Tax=Microcystis sp. LEGE 08355 TaxID=1828687 RepID=UPI0018805933|nr:hypothetical protein [Microcystis sp. LEGE 08355]MBE9073144.1 hypothetical protein [Microcystis sp. LEGE 08355]